MDRQKVELFLDRFTGLAAGATTIGLLAVADKSGLTTYLGEHPSGTADEIAEGAVLNERCVKEILSGLTAAGVMEYDPATAVFTLPPEHALFVSNEDSPYFMGGWFDMIPAMLSQIPGVTQATVHGGGVGFEEFGSAMIAGIDRGNGPSYRTFLIKRWLPAVPGLVEQLEKGIRVADVGCGSGTTVILIAEAFPNSEVFGYDVSGDSIAVCRSRAEHLSNTEFHGYTVEDIPTDPGFDLITTFDVIHDLTDPLAGLTRIHEALAPEGRYLMMEPNASSNLEENLHDRGALLYGVSTLHCMTQSLANGGAGLGTAWGRQQAEEMAGQAGFSSFEHLEGITNRFSAFYLLGK
jgi:SAM-dependent methyltransferase